MNRTALVVLTALSIAAQEDPDEIEKARTMFPPPVTAAILAGEIPAPAGFDDAVAKRIGADRQKALREGTDTVSGRDNDLAAVVLVRLGVKPEGLQVPGGRPSAEITVIATGSKYKAASRSASGSFKSGQNADIVLSAIGVNDSGGPLLFNHPMGIASDGTRLFLADTYNNRVLIWNKLPAANVAPDVVIGQKDFQSNLTGNSRDQLNFPVNVAAAGGRVIVTDTINHRLLVWNRCPEKNGEPADLVIGGIDESQGLRPRKDHFAWPWGVWSDGERLAVSSTFGGWVLIWNTFPTHEDQPADLLLTASGKFGTPRTITSDGKCLIVGDHNSKISNGDGAFVWKTFPTKDDQPYDYHLADSQHGAWLRGNFLSDGRLVLLGHTLHLWNGLPESEKTRPRLSITGYDFHGGDHVGSVEAGGRLYICSGNLNKVVVYRSIPTKAKQKPDFAIGAPDIETDTLETNFIISNPVPASNGRSLFVTSDFDRKFYVWKEIPDEDAAHPDFVYELPEGAWDLALWKETLVLGAPRTLYIWKNLPLAGERPDVVLRDGIGSVRFRQVMGAALDDTYLYLADWGANKLYVWRGLPSADAEPAFSLDVEGPGRLASDGTWLAVSPRNDHDVRLYRVKDLSARSKPGIVGRMPVERQREIGPKRFNGVGCAEVRDGRLYVADVWGSKVHIWNRVEDALDGKDADVLLGRTSLRERLPSNARNGLSYPAAVCFDGTYLWVGETKFSERLLRFRPAP